MRFLDLARLVALVVCLTIAITAANLVAVSGMFTYQGRLTDQSGSPLTGTYSLQFSIYTASTGGTAIWSETYPAVNASNGLFSVDLGSQTQLPDTVFSNIACFIGVTIGSDPELAPRQLLSSALYAQRVASIDRAKGGTIQGATTINGNTNISGATDLTGFTNIHGQLTVNKAPGEAALVSNSIASIGFNNTGLQGYGENGKTLNIGVLGLATDATSAPAANCAGVYGADIGNGGTVWAGYFDGWANVTGNLYAAAKFFRIDDPQQPAERTLTHACVESNEFKNIYDGEVILDDKGEATVTLPDWFESLNTEFRYQLTCVGDYAPVYVSAKIANSQFGIAGGKPGLEVSWQVTGVRKDPYALAHSFQVIQEKPAALQGKYLHPLEQGVSEDLGVDHAVRKYIEDQRKAVAPPSQ